MKASVLACILALVINASSLGQDSIDPDVVARMAEAQAKLSAKSHGTTRPTTQASVDELRSIIRAQASELAQLQKENGELKKQLATIRSLQTKAGATIADKIVAPKIGITEATLKSGWKVTKLGEGPGSSLSGNPIFIRNYSLGNQTKVMVVNGKVDRISLEPQIGMAEDDLIEFNQHQEVNGQATSVAKASENESDIYYRDGWQATVDKSTHKVVSWNK